VHKIELPKNNVQVTDAHGNAMILQQVLAGKGLKMLGIYKAANLNETAEFAYLKEKST